jgi:hypothetical protein
LADEWIGGFVDEWVSDMPTEAVEGWRFRRVKIRESSHPFIKQSNHPIEKKPAACLRKPPGTKPNSEERQLKARRIPADLKEDWAPSLDAEGAGRYRTVFCNCCIPSFQQGMYQRRFERLSPEENCRIR